jgi:GH25 family lysozyme M1 (1,4-beta-N-acetylmuramidase)
MRGIAVAGVVLSIVVVQAWSPVNSQEIASVQDEVDPSLVRPFWLGGGAVPAAPPYTLTPQDRELYGGVFGIDLSHYSFDIDASSSKCKTQEGYDQSACSCTADWDVLARNKLLYLYTKASDGAGIDLSFARAWSQLGPKQESKTLFRGAYHFFRPGVDPDVQANTFLRQIGAVDGKRPQQLPPALDIEWSNKQVIPGTTEFNACPTNRRTNDNQGRFFCDMWYKVPAADIAAMAKKWIDTVESRTGRPVIIYTNPTAWWNPVMNGSGDDLTRTHAIWTSRYTVAGPQYNPNWTTEGGSPHWKMPPLPRGASYPQTTYNVAHFWQFSEGGYLPSNLLTCSGQPARRAVDLNWLPIAASSVPALFGIGNQ